MKPATQLPAPPRPTALGEKQGRVPGDNNGTPKNTRLPAGATSPSARAPRFDASRYGYTLSAATVFIGALLMTYNIVKVDPTQFRSFEPLRQINAKCVEICADLARVGPKQTACSQYEFDQKLLASANETIVIPQLVAEALSASVSSLGAHLVPHMEDTIHLLLIVSGMVVLGLHLHRIQQMYAARQG